MDRRKYEYQGEFARRYVALGEAEGERKGRIALLTRQLTLRFGPLGREAQTRIAEASIPDLDQIASRLLIAQTLDEAMDSR